ncbi:MAG: hypothetical protein IIV40_03020 [Oscillospiraceae bacterium]|nr:hypothetical protein [Oscillospiraceae bacterium]
MRFDNMNFEPSAMPADGLAKMRFEQAQAGAVAVQPIGRQQILKAQQTLQEYKTGKKNLEDRIIDNEQWYKLRHWECMRKSAQTDEVEPSSAWLFNCIMNKHADAMDSFPSANILPREAGDKKEAEMLSSIIPVILEHDNFEKTYSDAWHYKLTKGTGPYAVFWEPSKLNGLGDISIQQVDLLNLFWEPGVKDIQKSRNFFQVELRDNEVLEQEYPQLKGRLGSSVVDVSKYIYDDTVDTSHKSAVVDWYYKKPNSQGKEVLHYCKYVNDEVLYASENDPERSERGFYDDGKYPFVFDPLFPVEGSPCGFSYIDVGKNPQSYIDFGNQGILKNLLANAKPRHFVRKDGGINEEEYADTSNDFVHVAGALGEEAIRPIQATGLSPVYLDILRDKVDELKETTGNRDISTGGTTAGVTAASAIAAMQEAGSKLSRDMNKASYRAFREIIFMVIERIRQFYDLSRQFRITGAGGIGEQFVSYSNKGIVPQYQGVLAGEDMGYRVPQFDLEVTAQKASPYSRMSQNELALQFFGQGFFNPQLADQALACLDMMDFDRKNFVMEKIQQNGGMYQMMMQMQQQMLGLAQIIDQDRGTNLAQQIAAGAPLSVMGGMVPEGEPQEVKGAAAEALGGSEGTEPANTREARKRVADSTNPT